MSARSAAGGSRRPGKGDRDDFAEAHSQRSRSGEEIDDGLSKSRVAEGFDVIPGEDLERCFGNPVGEDLRAYGERIGVPRQEERGSRDVAERNLAPAISPL